ncbi:type IV inositol polyphosphate 5-phosphatase 3 isoform X1 [Lactuca sativa]|nr:type IV inositol polyphosphate 5-phosphatase 3 isoform X1 [Lactuca sativa]
MHAKRISANSSLMKHRHHEQHHPPSKNQGHEVFWPRIVIRKWLNRSGKDSDYSADPEDEDSNYDSEGEEDSYESPKETRVQDKQAADDFQSDNGAFPRSRRRKSETMRAQYIEAKELKVSVSTWNVGGKLPSEDLNINDMLDVDNPADIYVIGFQEIIPLNAGNIFGAEDNRPVPIWENVIRGTLNKIQPEKTKFKCYSNPSSPSRFKPSEDAPDIEDEVVLESDSEGEEEVHPFNEESCFDDTLSTIQEKKLVCFPSEENVKELVVSNNRKLTRILSGTERIGLSWPEPPLDLLAQCATTERPNSLKTVKSFTTSKSFRSYASFKSYINVDINNNRVIPEEALVADLDLDSTLYRKRRPPYVKIVSKQMVGVFITIWVRRRLRKHIQNVHVSAVGVGVMGYIGNKGSISVSMSIYQTLFCFICTHLTSGEREADAAKRNADVHEIHKRTRFSSFSKNTLPKKIDNHDRIIWLGDLNYRLNLSYDKTRDLISKNRWPKLSEYDQLIKELRKGRAFDGWSEGILDFAPTYKYEQNSERYYGEDPKVGRRTPAWCDRILSYGKGIRQMSYRRTEFMLSDHRPVSACYMIEVEVFSPRRLQKALTFTDAEIENDGMVSGMGIDRGINHLRLKEDTYW